MTEVAPWIIAAHKSGEWLPTRGGDKRRVICVDAPQPYPVIVMDMDGDPAKRLADGRLDFGVDGHYDLLPPKRQFDVCVYGDHDGGLLCCIAPATVSAKWTLLARATIEEGEGI